MLLSSLTAGDAQNFGDSSSSLPRGFAYGTSAADVDSDGLMDLLCFTWGSEPLFSLHKQRTNGTFLRHDLPAVWRGHLPALSFWGDYDRDGLLDAIFEGEDFDQRAGVYLLKRDTAGEFITEHLLPGSPIGWFDLDNDGRLDLAVLSEFSRELTIYYSEDLGGFTAGPALSARSNASTFQAFDLDNDGDLDVIIPSQKGYLVYRNDGNRHFTDTGVYLPANLFVDMDGDGYLDVVYNEDIGHVWSHKILYNQGGLVFEERTLETGPTIFRVEQAADFDGDNKPDLLLLAYPRGIGFMPRILYQRDNGAFEEKTIALPPVMEVRSVQLADLEADGDLDLIAFGNDVLGENRRRVFRYPASRPRSVPIPVNLAARINPGGVTLSWDPGEARGMSYNLRVGTLPGAGDIISPLSRPDGLRLVSQIGNAQTSGRWKLNRLQPGTYYWSVQAVDWGYTGSAFAAEATFIVPEAEDPPPSPFISTLPNVVTDEDVSPPSIPFSIGPAEYREDLEVTVESDNPALTPATGLVLSGEGVERTLSITAAPNAHGTASITVLVGYSFGEVAATSFLLSVRSVNDRPEIEAIPDQVLFAGQSLHIPLQISDVDFEPWTTQLQLGVTSSDPLLIEHLEVLTHDIRFGRHALRAVPAQGRIGAATLTVTANDGELEASRSFVIWVLPRLFESDQSFTGHSTWQSTAGWADFNNDGWLDLLVGIERRIYRNNAGSFLPQFGPGGSSWVLPSAGYSHLLLDLDRDNDVDLLFYYAGGYAYYRNDVSLGLETAFTPITLPGFASHETAPGIFPGDLDNDGDTDFISSGRVFRNDGARFVLLPASANFGEVLALADLDNDGWKDIVYSRPLPDGSHVTGIYQGRPGIHFQQAQFLPGSVGLTKLGVVDINQDGWPDIWLNRAGSIELYQNRQGVFDLVHTMPGWAVAWFDYNNDGRIDLLAYNLQLAGLPLRFMLHRNDGEFQFTPSGQPLNELSVGNVWLADYNRDGLIDLAGLPDSGQVSLEHLRLFANRWSIPNSPPAAPGALSASVSDGMANFSWAPAADLNQRGGLTYNVRIGTRPGGSDVVSAAALPDGTRLLAAIGNAEWRTNLLLTNLASDVYYWSVQAIDNGFAGGAFAPEQRLLVHLPGNLPPSISAPGDYTGPEDMPGEFRVLLSDDRTAPSAIQVRVVPDDPLLLPISMLSVEGSAEERIIRFLPSTNAFGQTTVWITATDTVGASSTVGVQVTITNINDPPVILPLQPIYVNRAAQNVSVPIIIHDVDHPVETLQLQVTSSHPDILPESNVVFSGTGAERIASFHGEKEAAAVVELSFRVIDPAGASTQAALDIHYTNRVFTLINTNFVGIRDGSIAWGDFDNDGDLDLVISGQGTPRIGLYVNEGNSSFQRVMLDILSVDGGGVEWGDYDNDGDLDLLVHGRDQLNYNFIAELYQNDGAGQFTRVQWNVTGLDGPAAFGDFDGDGDLDLITTGSNAVGVGTVVLYRNDGGEFVLAASFDRLYANLPFWEDFDLDGMLDLRLRPAGDSLAPDRFFTRRAAEYHAVNPIWNGNLLAWGDLNLDGLPDALASRAAGPLYIFHHDGHLLRDAGSLGPNAWHSHVALGDYDNDGYLDILLAQYSISFEGPLLYRNNAGLSFHEVATPLESFPSTTAAWADYDNDGDLDLLTTGQSSDGYLTRLYRNDQDRPNQPPSAPPGVRAWFSAEGLVFEWDEAEDPNQSGGLTYNLAVGTRPGEWDVLHPMSRSDGWRMLPKPGNAGWLKRKVITGAPLGISYHYTVQAIDNSFAGGPFAPTQTITVSRLPVIVVTGNRFIREASQFVGEILILEGEGNPADYQFESSSSDSSLFPPSSIEITWTDNRHLLQITPAPDRFGSAEITLQTIAPAGGLASYTFTLTVEPNLPPIFYSQVFRLPQDQPLLFLPSAADPEGDSLTFRVTAPPFNGMITPVDGQFLYSPRSSFFGVDWTGMEVEDEAGNTVTAAIYFLVEPADDLDQPRFGHPIATPEGLSIPFQGEPFRQYTVETSSDLRTWTVFDTISSATGDATLQLPHSFQDSMRFIRVVSP